jgi:hypothetical protein
MRQSSHAFGKVGQVVNRRFDNLVDRFFRKECLMGSHDDIVLANERKKLPVFKRTRER